MRRRWLVLSYLLFFIPVLFILNFLFPVVSLEKIQGLPVFFSIIFCPIAIFFAVMAHRLKKDIYTYLSIFANSVLFVFPFIFMMLGTVYFGV